MLTWLQTMEWNVENLSAKNNTQYKEVFLYLLVPFFLIYVLYLWKRKKNVEAN